ncbi:histone H1-like [Epinephelus lanceolatus]|uniref:histone H1-like n=1 Tax=Epinephelus lanceolatus TaxID=310571 RepID=UPI001446C66E|nr:histone H1-like [Epinephelus lanceolatus]
MDGPPKNEPRRKKNAPLGTADLVFRAVSATKDRKGMSYVALKKALAAQGYDVETHAIQIKRAVKYLVKTGALLQMSGCGASGSYKANKNAGKPTSVADKAAAKKPKAATPKKAEKPVAAKKTPVSKNKKTSKKKA